MKKTIYTIALIALFSVVSNAQTTSNKQEPAKAETVNPDGTISTAPVATDNIPTTAAPESKSDDTKTSEKPKSGTRMAITEKGVPASKKAAEGKKEEPAKAEKH